VNDRPLSNLERLRETVATRVQSTSLRSVARQVGMSPTGLEKFLSGGTPYSRSRQKLQEWAEREGGRPSSDMTVEGVEVAIGALVRDLPAEHRLEAIRRLVRSLRQVYGLQAGAAPEWLDRLAATWLDEDEWPEGEEDEFEEEDE
jgi:transcriptional regulator with XRE-family HTH domain